MSTLHRLLHRLAGACASLQNGLCLSPRANTRRAVIPCAPSQPHPPLGLEELAAALGPAESVEVPSAVLDELAEAIASPLLTVPWFADLPAARVPALVVELALEQAPSVRYRDAAGRLHGLEGGVDRSLREWLVASGLAAFVLHALAVADGAGVEGGRG